MRQPIVVKFLRGSCHVEGEAAAARRHLFGSPHNGEAGLRFMCLVARTQLETTARSRLKIQSGNSYDQRCIGETSKPRRRWFRSAYPSSKNCDSSTQQVSDEGVERLRGRRRCPIAASIVDSTVR